jgi:hypothetical protein
LAPTSSLENPDDYKQAPKKIFKLDNNVGKLDTVFPTVNTRTPVSVIFIA